MRKIMMLLLLFSMLSFAWADEWEQRPSITETISAYKDGSVNANLPQHAVAIRLLDPSMSEFEALEIISIPTAYRNNFYTAFYWVLSGNTFGNIKLKFTFYPMRLQGTSEITEGEYIPYEVCLVHTESRIGNSVIKVNTVSTADSYTLNSYAGTQYRCYYADSVSGASTQVQENGTQVTTSLNGTQMTVTYNMSTKTAVKNASGQDKKSAYITSVSSYTDPTTHVPTNLTPVCDHWNRTGVAYVKLGITQEAKLVDDESVLIAKGNYYSTVVVEVSLQ